MHQMAKILITSSNNIKCKIQSCCFEYFGEITSPATIHDRANWEKRKANICRFHTKELSFCQPLMWQHMSYFLLFVLVSYVSFNTTMNFVLILLGLFLMSATNLTTTTGNDVRFVRTDTSRFNIQCFWRSKLCFSFLKFCILILCRW